MGAVQCMLQVASLTSRVAAAAALAVLRPRGCGGCDDPEEPDDAGVVDWARWIVEWRILPVGAPARGSVPWRCSDLRGRSCACGGDVLRRWIEELGRTRASSVDWAEMVSINIACVG